MEAQEAVNKLCDHLLGKDWYIADPVSTNQANDIIVEEIIGKYKGVTESPINRWRRRHKKCKFCKHCVPVSVLEGNCLAKDKIVDMKISRPFCSVFQLKPYNDD